jgi:Family of unknown function (DUF6502)
MDSPLPTLGVPSARVIASLRLILRPMVRFMLRQGVTYPLLTDLLKSVFVEVARDEFTIEGKRQTDSRISLLTGVHRKDVKRLVDEERSGGPPPLSVSFGAQLVARWVSDPEFLDPEGHPIPLPRLASEGGALSFESLVEGVSKDIRSRVVLDEWLHLGVARLDERDRVCLNVAAFVPEHGFTEKLFYFGQNVHDHMAAAVHNLSGNSPPLFERSVYYDQLAPDSVEELAKLSSELGMSALQAVNRRAIELERRDADRPDAAKLRMNFGMYYFSSSRQGEQEDGAEGEGGTAQD